MKILHTADWHIGQMFYNFDRTGEHVQFLDWLVETISREAVDAVLISGDVFDTANPPAESVRLFYSFLREAVRSNPHVQIIAIAGNHDSAARFESPRPLLENSRIHLIGTTNRNAAGEPDFSSLLIPLTDKQNRVKARCMAIPYLRPADLPHPAEGSQTYSEGVEVFYRQAYHFAQSTEDADIPLIVMGHLHLSRAEVTDMDKHERVIMGGLEGISPDVFGESTVYTALGHIHKAQRIGGNGHIQYSGSPLPMSFSEHRYRHRVFIAELDSGGEMTTYSCEVPVTVPLLRIPEQHALLPDVIDCLQALPDSRDNEQLKPFLEVRVLLEQPEPSLRHVIDRALTGKFVRLARIDIRYPDISDAKTKEKPVNSEALRTMTPEEVFSKTYALTYNTSVPDNMLQLFREAVNSAQTEPE